MTYYVGNMPVGDDELMHYGTKGMRWGQRRFQNRDGSLTAAGRLRYGWGRAKRGAGRAYGQARRTAKRTYKKAGNWYQRNKKTIGKVALGAGAVGLAAAGAVGFRNRKAIARAARVLGGKAFPAGTRRAQSLSKLRYNVGNFGSKANRGVRNAADTLKRRARIGSQVNSSMFTGKVKDTASRYGAKVRRTADNISRTKFGQKAKGAANKSADYIRRTPSRISAKKMNASRLNKQKNLYRSTGIRGDLMTDKVISRMNKVDAVKRKARTVGGKVKEAPKNVVRKVSNARTRRTNTKNVSRAMAENEFARRRMHLRNETGKDLAKGKLSDVARLRLRRTADKVGGTYQKTKNKVQYKIRRASAGSKVRSAADRANRYFGPDARKRVANTVKSDLNKIRRTRAPRNPVKTYKRKQAAKAVVGVAGLGAGAYGGYKGAQAVHRAYKRRKKSRR